MTLFQYALIWTPTEKQIEDEDAKPKLISDIETTLANDLKHAEMIAARAIPAGYGQQLDQITVAVRPF